MKKKISTGKLVLGAVCAGVLFFLFTARPLSFFDAVRAKVSYIHGTIQYEMISIPDADKAAIVDAFTKVKVPWIPSDASVITSRDAAKDHKIYVNLVFEEQMFVDLFVYVDDSMAAYIYPWERPLGMRVEYAVKNPEVLQRVVDIAVKCGIDEGIIEAGGE